MLSHQGIGEVHLVNFKEPLTLYAKIHWSKEMDIRILQDNEVTEFKFYVWENYGHNRIYLSKRTKNPSIPIKEMTIEELLKLPPLYDKLGYFDLKNIRFCPEAEKLINPVAKQVFRKLISLLYQRDKGWHFPKDINLCFVVDKQNKVELDDVKKGVHSNNSSANINTQTSATSTTDAFVINPTENRDSKCSDNDIPMSVCENCMERFECFESYSHKLECRDYRPGPTKRPDHWPKEMLGPYGK